MHGGAHANTKVGYRDDAVRDKANYEANYSKIHGDINLVGMNFNTDKAKTLTKKPKVVAQQSMVNNGSIQQSMEFDFTVTQGTTKSSSHQIGFKYGVKIGFEASFFKLVGEKYEASFGFSHNNTVLGFEYVRFSISQMLQKKYSYNAD